MNKKMTSVIIAFLMIFSLCMPINAFGAVKDYDGHWAEETIQLWIDKDYIEGYPDGSFKPEAEITRVEFATMVNGWFDCTQIAEISFSDVKADMWYYQEVQKAFKAGYIQGITETQFSPEDNLTREQAVVIISRIMKLDGNLSGVEVFSDNSKISSWATDLVGAAADADYIKGYEDNTFRPGNFITRAEAIVMLNRLKNDTETDTGTDTDTDTGTGTDTGTDTDTDTGTETDTDTDTDTDNPSNEVAISSVKLGLAGDYAILSKSGISSVPNSVVTGNIGVSPIDSTSITGFSLIADKTNEFSTSTQVIGEAHASDYSSTTPINLTTAISNMETAFTDAAGRAVDYTELYTGDISGKTLTPGVYKWSNGISINSDVTIHGGANDVWIFQIAKGITQSSDTKIILTGGAQAKNIFWQSSETVEIGTGAHFEGIVLCQTDIILKNLSSVNGRLLAQTAVTLDMSTVVAPD